MRRNFIELSAEQTNNGAEDKDNRPQNYEILLQKLVFEDSLLVVSYNKEVNEECYLQRNEDFDDTPKVEDEVLSAYGEGKRTDGAL